LQEIRAEASFRQIPVVVLSTSGAERDVKRAYLLGANSYVVKPMEMDEFTAAIHSIQSFWLETARLTSS
jgi:DNA-binding response OmpR family regulator